MSAEIRKPIQITSNNNKLVALCNDGTIYELQNGGWVKLTAIPQQWREDKEKKDEHKT